MSTIHYRIPLDATPDDAWRVIADLEGVHHLISFLDDATVTGDRRTCRIAQGAPMSGALDEIILGVHEEERRVAYAITSSPFGFEAHAASMQIVCDAEGVTQLIWISDIKPDGLAAQMAPMFEQEARHIGAQISRLATS